MGFSLVVGATVQVWCVDFLLQSKDSRMNRLRQLQQALKKLFCVHRLEFILKTEQPHKKRELEFQALLLLAENLMLTKILWRRHIFVELQRLTPVAEHRQSERLLLARSQFHAQT